MEKLLRRAAHLEPGKFNDLSSCIAKLSKSAFLKYLFLCAFALVQSSGMPFYLFQHAPFLLGCTWERTYIVLSSTSGI